MQVQFSTNKKQTSSYKLNSLLNQASFYDCSPSAMSATLPQKMSLSQAATRENSNNSNSSQEEEAIMTGDAEFQIEKEFHVESPQREAPDSSSSFQPQSHDEARRSYINKLVNLKILDLQPKKKCQNLSIFDWDDTLFCTSFLGDQPFHKIPEDVKSIIQMLDNMTKKLIVRASKMSEVYIITNSDARWVEQSAQVLLPLTYEVISRKSIKIISARKEYKDQYPDDLARWKLEAFLSLRSKYQNDVMTNMVVIGDSDLEIRAAHALGTHFKQAIVKTVKFQESPSLEELVKQHRIVLNSFDEIFAGCKSMTVRLGKTKGQ